MAQISSFDASVKASLNDLIDSIVGSDPAILQFPNENLINVPQYNLFTQFSTINNFTNDWEMDNKFQQFNTFNNVENLSQNKIGNHLRKSSHTMRLWQRRMNSQKGKEKEFEALQDPHSEIDTSSSNKSCSPSSMFNGDESQLQILQECVSRKSGTTYIDQFMKNLLSQTQSQDASTTDPLQSFVNFTSASHKQQGLSPILSIDAKNKRRDTILRESKDIYLQKSSKPSPKSPSSLQERGEGVIGKMIVPFVSGETVDGVNVWKEEGVQLRHVCPHAGCEKHFSTSGHARRHSRIHDRLHPFRCPHKGCYTTFTRRDNCTQHQRAKHKAVLLAHRIKDVEL